MRSSGGRRVGSPIRGNGPPGSPGTRMSWVPLDLRRGPTFAQECDEVIRTYGQAFLDGAQDVLDYLKTAIESRIATLEEFCRNNDTDPRHVVFDKQLRKLRRVLHNDPAMFAAQAGGAGAKQGGLRQPGEDVPPPPPPPEEDDETDSDDGVENVVGDDEADGLFRRASKMNLEEIPDAAKAKARGSVTMGASSMMASPRQRKQSTIYSWERSGSMQAAAAKEEEILNIGGGASDESPFPPGFTFKVVLSNKEFHHLMARRRVQLAEKRHKHISKRVQQSNKDGKGTVDLKVRPEDRRGMGVRWGGGGGKVEGEGRGFPGGRGLLFCTVPLQCTGALAVPWRCLGGALVVPWRCLGGALAVPWRRHGPRACGFHDLPDHVYDDVLLVDGGVLSFFLLRSAIGDLP